MAPSDPPRTIVPPVVGLVGAIVLGCVTQPPPRLAPDDAWAALLRTRDLDPREIILPYALNDEMREWIAERFPPKMADEEKLDLLAEQLLSSDRLRLEYEFGYTGTAVEVFESQRANCLAFTNLFLGMAREIGIDVYFVTVDRAERFRKDGDLVVVSDHIAVAHGSDFERRVFDFAEVPSEATLMVRPIEDLVAVALFYSNRGAEALQSGDAAAAVKWLRTAVELEPGMARTWTNLGVALRRSGDFAAAEEAYRKAIELDPTLYSAYHNLASLLRRTERTDEAVELETVLVNSPHRNPYTYLHLGDLSLERGRLYQAQRFYERAVALAKGSAECLAALGQVAVRSGDLGLARRMLRRAEKLDPTETRTVVLARMLEEAPASDS